MLNLGFNKSHQIIPTSTGSISGQNTQLLSSWLYDNILGTDKLNVYVEVGYEKDAEINVDEQIKLTLEGMKRYRYH